MKYRMYIDEVGNTDMESSDNPNHRFLSLTGIIVELGDLEKTIHPQMEDLKVKYFGHHPDEPIVLHRKEMMNCKPPFDCLRDKDVRERFDGELLTLLATWHYVVISVCLDKKRHRETYTTWRYDPYHYCLSILVERFIFFLNTVHCQGDVMAESRGGREDERLKKSFEGLWKEGTNYVDQKQFQNALTSRQLKIKLKSNNITGLQLADIIAHPSRAEILRENGLMKKDYAAFTRRIVEILQGKYYQKKGMIHGKKFI